MKFACEPITEEFLEEIKPLLHAHWREIAHYQDIDLDPDYTQYLLMHKLKMIRVYTAREIDNTLCGYAVYFVKHSLHYKQSLQALQDIVYVSPSRRGMGMFLIKHADEELKKEGVQVVCQHIKAAHNFGPSLEKIGYTLQDLIYTKRLDQ